MADWQKKDAETQRKNNEQRVKNWMAKKLAEAKKAEEKKLDKVQLEKMKQDKAKLLKNLTEDEKRLQAERDRQEKAN